jgi:hypothetical protein
MQLLLLLGVYVLIPEAAISQVTIKGKVTEENETPIPYASVKLMHHTSGIVTDTAGYFKLSISASKQNDTIVISSIGYESLYIPVRSALKNSGFILKSSNQKMDAVVIKSFGKEDIAGAQSEIVGYFRSWNTGRTGGEIGRSINVPHKEYQISKIRFKIYSSCDTCVIRLHIREFINRLPGTDLLKDTIEKTIIKADVADKAYEFDLSQYNIILSKENIFVSFEVRGGSNANYSNCSLAFVGSEPGIYIYRTRFYDDWTYTDDYAIFMKVFFKYD